MRCRHTRKVLLDEGAVRSDAVQEHLRTCASCAAYSERWERLRTGLRRVAEQAPPEPSIGFARRIARSLQDASLTGRLVDLSMVSWTPICVRRAHGRFTAGSGCVGAGFGPGPVAFRGGRYGPARGSSRPELSHLLGPADGQRF